MCYTGTAQILYNVDNERHVRLRVSVMIPREITAPKAYRGMLDRFGIELTKDPDRGGEE
jgi:hypothetical protein